MTPEMVAQHESVLTAVKRTALANGGAPLGAKSFYRETGLTKNGLQRAGFTNYGAAVKAAGLTPNKLREAFTDDHLFAPLAELTRRLGRMPTTDERAVARMKDAAFPSYDAYKRRAKAEPLNVALLNWCRRDDSFSDIAAIVEPSIAPSQAKPAKRKRIINGYVYLMRYGANGKAYKVGHSENVQRRHAQLANMVPDDLRYIHAIITDDPRGIEAYWKNRFADRLVKGKTEIFHLTADDIAAFKCREYQ